jgi:ssDNA-binding Zn-finger/Zn-ribbon topoisomerase 1
MTQNENPRLRYEQEEYETDSGRTYEAAVYYHPEKGDTLVGPELGEKTESEEEADEYEMKWTCPACGESHLSSEWDERDDELKDAGWTSIHLPCADEVDEEMAEKQEAAVTENLRAAEDDHIKDPQRY